MNFTPEKPFAEAHRRTRRDALRLVLGTSILGSADLARGLPLGTSPTGHANEVDAAAFGPALTWSQRVLHGFGTTLWLRAAHHDVARLDRALDAAVRELRDIEAALSLFQPDSSVSRLNRSGRLLRPDAHLRTVLAAAIGVSRASRGAFDITVQPLWACWQEAGLSGRVPTSTEIKHARRLVGWQNVRLQDSQVGFDAAGMSITLNGIAQGYAADRVAAILRASGIEHALMDTGEWAGRGLSPEQRPWQLGLEDPAHPERLLMSLVLPPDMCVATSSVAHHRFTADARQHHILDPRTGESPPDLAAVLVMSRSAMLADALTKVLFMAGPSDALHLARQWGVMAATVDRAGGVRTSRELARYQHPANTMDRG